VAKTITMPTSPNFSMSSFNLIRMVGTTVSPFTGQTKTQEYDAVYWVAELTLPPMKRAEATEWQSFFLELNGQTNNFLLGDPSALTNTGTYSTSYLEADKRVNNTSVTLSFSGSTITAGASTFATARAGDFIHVTGATNEENNGTHKITSVTSNTVVVTDSTLTTESNTASCKVRQNVKGSTGLSLLASTNSATGTIKKGDYLGVLSAASDTSNPQQLVMVVEDATVTTDSGKDFYSVKTEPKLRSDLTDGFYVKFTSPKGLFRLTNNEIDWRVNTGSFYTMGFSCIEVI
tara:strand:- start:4615 stop:5484 length:870 start_codon:yes stop_codon:yes gene_type:complete